MLGLHLLLSFFSHLVVEITSQITWDLTYHDIFVPFKMGISVDFCVNTFALFGSVTKKFSQPWVLNAPLTISARV